MVYVGSNLPSLRSNEPALLDPSLPIKIASNRRPDEPLHYFPSYEGLDKEARTIYLSWLADGRNEPHIDIGYVFLFFYGLERRVLVDIHKEPTFRHEIPAIAAEVKRLCSLYQTNQSFYGYAISFLTFILAKYHPEQLKVTQEDLKDRKAFPFSLKCALAQFALQGQPLPAPAVFAWFERSPHSILRTPAKRCRTEFFKLFKIYYHAEFGRGFVIRVNEPYLSLKYKPANSSLSGQTYFYELNGLPDVSALTEPISAFQKIVDSCIEVLDPFSRYLGRKSNQSKPRVFAFAHLPAELLRDGQFPEIELLRAFMESNTGSHSNSVVECSELLAALKLSPEQALSRTDSLLIAQLLGRLDYGIEPDARFSGQRIIPQKKAVIFPLREHQAHTASAEYTFASLLLTVSSLIVHADGTVSEAEEKHLRSYLSTALSLTPEELQRLDAYLMLLLVEPPSLQSIKKHVHSLTEELKNIIAEFLIALAAADGHVAPEEINILKKLYAVLELDHDSLYSAIHTQQTHKSFISDDDAQQITSSREPLSNDTGISLNMDLIAHTLQQTEQVQSLLADVFEETSEIISPVHQSTQPSSQEIHCLPHLDQNHSALFHQIAHLDHISLDEFTTLCKQLDVLPGGAIEALNTAAFEMVDEPLLEENGDMLFIDQEVAKEMST